MRLLPHVPSRPVVAVYRPAVEVRSPPLAHLRQRPVPLSGGLSVQQQVEYSLPAGDVGQLVVVDDGGAGRLAREGKLVPSSV